MSVQATLRAATVATTLCLFPQVTLAQAVTAEVELIREDAGVRSDRRPVAPGLYDPISNQSYISWMGGGSDIFAAYYDHASDTWFPDAGSSSFKVDDGPFLNKHNYPVMAQTPDGHIHLFYGAHNSTLYQVRSNQPNDITSGFTTGPLAVTDDATYPMPFVDDAGDMYVFYRETTPFAGSRTDDRPKYLIRSSDNGLSFSEPTQVIGHNRSDRMDEIYMGQIRHESGLGGGQEKLHMTWTLAGGGVQGHAHDRFHKNLYYAWMDPATDLFYDAGNNLLGSSIDEFESDNNALVLDTGVPDARLEIDYVQLVETQADGDPLVIFNQLGQLKRAVWDASTALWDIAEIATLASDSDALYDMTEIGPDEFVLMGLVDDSADGGPERVANLWYSNDGGESWLDQGSVMFDGTPIAFDHAYFLTNYNDELAFMGTEYYADGQAGADELNSGNRDLFSGRIIVVPEPLSAAMVLPLAALLARRPGRQ